MVYCILLLVSLLASTLLSAAAPDVVLITIDTLRADRVGCYGYSKASTPTLDRLAHDGTMFTNTVSHVPLTRPSHLTIFTGLYPFQHQIHDNVAPPLDPKIPTLAEILQKNGYTTGAFVASFVVNSQSGLQRGFETYADEFDPQKQPTQFALNLEKRGEQVYREFSTWQNDLKTKPYFAWVHLYDPHFPYDPPPPFSSRFKDHPYDGEVAYADDVVSKILKLLRPNTLLIVTSDHGESLGDHDENAHSYFIYDSTLRVPLFLRWPGKIPAAKKIDFQTRLIDLFPTILDLLNIAVPKTVAGISLEPWLQQTSEQPPDSLSYCETFTPWLHFGWSRLQGVRSGKWKYIEAPESELYDLRKDPAELNNLYSKEATPVRDLRKWLQQSGALNAEINTGSMQDLDPETLEKLASLGYAGISSHAPPPAANLPDPKDKIADFRLFNQTIREGIEAFQAEQYAKAVKEFELLRSRNIPSFEVHYYLGRSYLRLKSYDKARTELELALQKLPHFLPAYRDLSEAWEAVGKPKKAEEALQAGLTISPHHPLLVQPLAWLYQRQKNYSAAEKLLLAELKEHPQDLESRYRLGAIYRNTDRTDLAIQQFREIVSRAPQDPEAHNQLGMLYGAQGRNSQAAAEFKKAAELSPKNESYAKNLALVKGHANLVRFRIIQTKTKAAADVIYRKLQKGESWQTLAQSYSIHPSARSQQPVLEVNSSELEAPIAKELAQLKHGEFSEPIETSSGFFLVLKE
jgi:choline-sulfatase